MEPTTTLDELLSSIKMTVAPDLSDYELNELKKSDVVEFFDVVCKKAYDEGAADIFWKTGSPPALRIGAQILKMNVEKMTRTELEAIFVDHVMNDLQREHFKTHPEIDAAKEIPGLIRFRVNIYKQRDAPASVMRLIPLELPTIDELNLPKVLSTMVTHKQGMILVTGPTGSGKTTTLAALLDLMNTNRRVNIISIEDPIEFVHRDKLSIMSQRQVGTDTNNFHDALRAVLRQAPDVIFVGEMRDVETMSVAMTAAETGHLVFSTVHTNSASETIERVVNMYQPHEKPQICLRLSNTLRGILSQKLVPKIDRKGRVCGIEILVNTPTIAKMIEDQQAGSVLQAINEGSYWGMQSMNTSLLNHYISGSIDEETAVAYAGNATEMRQMIRRLAQSNIKASASTM